MFDPGLVEELLEERQVDSVAGAFVTILNSGLIEAQIERERLRLTSSYVEEDVELLKQIREYRRKEATLTALKQFCESMKGYLT